MVTTLQFIIILTELIETKQEFDVKDDTFNKVREEITIYKQWEITSVLINKATHLKLTIYSSFQSQSTLFWEMFKWEKICKLVQIGGIIFFYNFFYYVNNFCWYLHRSFLYMLSIIVLRKKIVISKIRYRQVTLTKKSESSKKIAIGASLIKPAAQ